MLSLLCLPVAAVAEEDTEAAISRLREQARFYSLQADSFHRAGNDTQAYLLFKRGKSIADTVRNLQHDQFIKESQRRMTEIYRFRLVSILMLLLLATIAVGIYVIRRQQRHNRELTKAHLSEQKALEEAERALRVKRDFLNNISHEMRTPLNSINGFSEVLAMQDLELSQEEKKDLSRRISENTQLLTNIIENMIELSRAENITALEKTEMIAPNAVGREVCQHLKDEARKGVELLFDTSLADDFFVATNRMALGKVLTQLMKNALCFTVKGSVTLGVRLEASDVVFTVTDTGPGIGKEYREHLFDLFINTQDDVKTTGMGLSICQRLINLLGGTICLEHTSPEGSCFSVRIPKN
jgi:signal transduction histidine kinase